MSEWSQQTNADPPPKEHSHEWICTPAYDCCHDQHSTLPSRDITLIPKPRQKNPWWSSHRPRRGSSGGIQCRRGNDWPEEEEEKEQGRADSVEVSDQLIVAVVAKFLVKAHTQSYALVLDIISWYLTCVHVWGQPPLFPTSRKSLLATL